MRPPAAPRRAFADVVVGDDAVARVVAAVEHVQVVMQRQRLADLDAAHAVAVAVEPRRVAAEPEPRRQRRQDAAADAALGGNADAIDPFAGIVVHAGTGHHRERARDGVGRHDLFAGHRIDAAIGQRRGHDRDIARRHQDRALPEIDFQHRADVVLDDGGVAQEIADRAVAVAGRAFGGVDRFVDIELAPGKPAERLADIVEGAVALGLMDQAGAGDRAGIDHRIEGMVVGIEPDRVEGIARRLDADCAFHPSCAQRIQRQREHEWLRHRLDREGNPAVADLVDVAVEGGEADAEMIGVGLAEFRDVVGDGAAGLRGKIGVAGGEKPQQGRFRRRPSCWHGGAEAGARVVHVLSCRAKPFARPDFTSHRRQPKPVRWSFVRQALRGDRAFRSRGWRGPVLRRRRRRC